MVNGEILFCFSGDMILFIYFITQSRFNLLCLSRIICSIYLYFPITVESTRTMTNHVEKNKLHSLDKRYLNLIA